MDTMFGREAIAKRLGLPDSRGPQGMFSRGANVYRGGLPNAQSGSGNPNIGRPSTRGTNTGMVTPPPSVSALVGSLPPGAGSADPTINSAMINLFRSKVNKQGGY